MEAASERKIENIHAVRDCRLNRIEDVFAARAVTALINVVGEHVVVTQPSTRRYAGHIIDADTINHGRLASHAGGDPGGVSAVSLNCRRIEALFLRLVEENFCDDHFWRDVPAVLVGVMRSAILRIAFGKTGRVVEAGWIKE